MLPVAGEVGGGGGGGDGVVGEGLGGAAGGDGGARHHQELLPRLPARAALHAAGQPPQNPGQYIFKCMEIFLYFISTDLVCATGSLSAPSLSTSPSFSSVSSSMGS